MISQKTENTKSMYTPIYIYIFGKIAFFFSYRPSPCVWVSTSREAGEGFAGEMRGAEGNRVALRRRGGKIWRYSEKIHREKGTGNAMDCAHAGKGDSCNEKILPERLNQEES